MSIKLMNAVMECRSTRHLEPGTKSVLLMIANNASDEGHAISLRVEKIHDQTNLHERTIQKAFRTLIEEGFITITERRGRVSIYTIHIDRLMKATPGITPGVASSSSHGATGAANGSDEGSAPQAGTQQATTASAAKAGEGNSAAPGNHESSTPGVMPGVASCGSIIHSPGITPPAPGVKPPPPPASGHPPPALGHPSPLLLHKSTSLLRGDPDDLKKSVGEQNGKPLGAEELERRRRTQLADAERVMREKAAAGGARA